MKYLPSEEGFLGLSETDTVPPADARAVIIPFGLEASVTYGGGTAAGPAAILKASHQVELFDEEFWAECCRQYGIATLAPLASRAAAASSDAADTIPADIPAALDLLESLVAPLLAADKFPLILGGEHSLTAGAIRPFIARYPDLGILHFDAHADLRDGYGGEPYSHAAALRRVLDHPIQALVSIGIRNISAEEVPFLEANRHRIHIHWAKDRADWQPADIVEPLRGRPVYLTFDLDGFDTSLMPATGTPEPGGLFWDDAITIVRAAASACTLVGADVVELAPHPALHACDFLAAKLTQKILNHALCTKKPGHP